MVFDGLVVAHDGFLAKVNLHVIARCGFVTSTVFPDGLVLQSPRLTETLKLSRSDPDTLFLQIALDDGTTNPVSQFENSTDRQLVGCKRFELNDLCFAKHVFETKMWTFAHYA